MKNKKLILGCALGNCVHIGGLNHFLRLAEFEGFKTISLGPAVPIERLSAEIEKHTPDIVAVSYRLTPEVAENLFDSLKELIDKKSLHNIKFIFGGTPSVAIAARNKKIFDKVFDGTEIIDEIKAYLRGSQTANQQEIFPQTLIERIKLKYPYPIIRHHFGRPSLEETIEGVKKIAEAQVLDVISIGTDQNAQEFFFHPELMKPELDGAGGVPVRIPEDLRAIYEASRCGNYPLMRCYSGTNDLLKWAEMSVETINNAWAAIPLTWYSVMDGRSKRPLEVSIAENQSAMKWYAEHNIPVEVNESHQWSLRDAHDSLAVTMAFLAAYNAKKMGVKDYVAQYMFNTPPGTSPQMDIAKMLAKNKLIEELRDDNFRIYREVRAGIAHFSPNPQIAKGQLAASALISLSLQPHILHVVAYCEGDHAVYPEELIESCNIVHGVIQNTLNGLPDVTNDRNIIDRKNQLIEEARVLLEVIKKFGQEMSDDPLCDPKVLASAIKIGILDTPHFVGNPNLCGKIKTNLINGAWYAIDENTGNILTEKERLKKFFNI
ncbi:MAG: cobalamin B12-binding domain-containing protein [Melioribacter sp.]|uniref:cobalamin B12-binding domain-containing protein n=1 Tax=Rosettibacter primus TaxID=3111523 RepID=UPI00247E1FEF|nr:cobalamin B12-binding domain-containing protein [Melioribacter sp.]